MRKPHCHDDYKVLMQARKDWVHHHYIRASTGTSDTKVVGTVTLTIARRTQISLIMKSRLVPQQKSKPAIKPQHGEEGIAYEDLGRMFKPSSVSVAEAHTDCPSASQLVVTTSIELLVPAAWRSTLRHLVET